MASVLEFIRLHHQDIADQNYAICTDIPTTESLFLESTSENSTYELITTSRIFYLNTRSLRGHRLSTRHDKQNRLGRLRDLSLIC